MMPPLLLCMMPPLLLCMMPAPAATTATHAVIIHNVHFDKAIVKIQGGNEGSLTRNEKNAVRRFAIDDDDEANEVDIEEDVDGGRNSAQKRLDAHKQLKIAWTTV